MKAPKYQNIKTTVDGIVFDSAKEARRWSQLCLLQRADEISHLERQKRIPMFVNGMKICDWIPDFQYWDVARCQLVVEDVKSPATKKLPAYRIKVKLAKALHGIEVLET